MKSFIIHSFEMHWRRGIVSALLFAAIIKIAIFTNDVLPFNADEAVVALMARHIVQGQYPIFFYGQAYMGSLDAWLIAGGFLIFGQKIWVIRMVQMLLYLGTIYTTAQIAKSVGGNDRIGIVAAFLMAVPTINVTLYTTASLGGYGETMLIGNIIILMALRIATFKETRRFLYWVIFGFFVGLGFWVFGYSLVYSIPALVWLIWQYTIRIKSEMISREKALNMVIPNGFGFTIGGVIGAFPLCIFAYSNGMGRLLSELKGGAIAGVEQLSYFQQISQHLWSLLVLGSTVIFGIRPPWEVRWLVLPLLPFAMVFWLGAVCFGVNHSIKVRHSNPGWLLLVGVFTCVCLGFVMSPFGADPSGRYFLVLMAPLAIMAAEMILWSYERIGKWSYALAGLIIIYNLTATIQCASRYPPGITTQFYEISQIDHQYDQELISFLKAHNEWVGYTNYWVSYPLAFLSQEELIYTPKLPYHADFRYTERDNRYEPYEQVADSSKRAAYITTNHPALDQYLRKEFSKVNVTWQEAKIGDFQIFYNLSRKITPEQIGLGRNR